MFALTLKIFTLQALEVLEGESYTNLRQIIYKLQKAKQPLEWKSYRFIKAGGAWMAVPKEADVEIIDLRKKKDLG